MSILHDPRALRALDRAATEVEHCLARLADTEDRLDAEADALADLDAPLAMPAPDAAHVVVRVGGPTGGFWIAARGPGGRTWFGSLARADAEARELNRRARLLDAAGAWLALDAHEAEVDADAPTDADLAEYGRWLAETSPDYHTDEPTPVEVIEDTRDRGDDAPWWSTCDLDSEMDAVYWNLADEAEAEATARLDRMAEGTLEARPDPVGDDDMPHYVGNRWHDAFA